ncbi:MAG: DUF1788 domain-containing protein [Methylococcaceae bacterium]|jgi:hypothetical protein|nr:DUF1788 domain-containing protein [Methylococcaceae bacterium]MDP2394277.1 DUF1788 domain-containing protein [Methylococcaceae bacterium]MDP3019372.1 DUF1788 domain-containing protein [Methylococcaceae bacterium]MDP3390626.1 DUF1788 domain-containing protein [Methylococcaceae bacterium]MDZ4155415.1 DUF1788 domain-containing protein [Methylococcales bacterium]
MALTFEERLNQILPKISSDDFLNSAGLGNEIGFWIFDYPPEREMEMRDFLSRTILTSLNKSQPAIRAGVINLFELVIQLLQERNLLDKAIEMQRSKGDEAVMAALRPVLKEDKLAKKVVSLVDLVNIDVLILSGVGSAYPMLRTHTLLSALHPLVGRTPLLMFYPGRYDGYSLRLFNKLSEDHYYRAFRLVPDVQ